MPPATGGVRQFSLHDSVCTAPIKGQKQFGDNAQEEQCGADFRPMEISVCLLQPLAGGSNIAVPQRLFAFNEVQARILCGDLTVQNLNIGGGETRRLADGREHAEIALDHSGDISRNTVRTEAAAGNHLFLITNAATLASDAQPQVNILAVAVRLVEHSRTENRLPPA